MALWQPHIVPSRDKVGILIAAAAAFSMINKEKWTMKNDIRLQFLPPLRFFITAIVMGGLVLSIVASLCFVQSVQAGMKRVKLSEPMIAGGGAERFLISPDGSRVVYEADQDIDGIYELYSVPIGGGTVTKLNGTLVAGGMINYQYFAISPDSSRVVYIADQDIDEMLELYSVPIIGGTVTKLSGTLVSEGDITDFAISPDSSRVVFRGDRSTNERFLLYSVPITGGSVTSLINGIMPVSADVSDNFAISSDSANVVFLGDFGTNNVNELYSVSINGGSKNRLNSDLVSGGAVDYFSISPDGTTVVYRADQSVDDKYMLYSVPIGDGTVTPLIGFFTLSWADVSSNFQISPDSSRVVFAADFATDDVFDLHSVPLGGGSVTKLNGDFKGSAAAQVTISPDSSHVVYQAEQDTVNEYDLYTVPLGGGTAVKLNPPLVTGGKVVWVTISPDSKRVVYRADQDISYLYELYSIPLEGGDAIKLSSPPVTDGDVTYDFMVDQPHKRVIYKADQDTDEVYELYTVPLDGGTVVKLNGPSMAMTGGDVGDFDISADSRWVVYIGDQDILGTKEVYSVRSTNIFLSLPAILTGARAE